MAKTLTEIQAKYDAANSRRYTLKMHIRNDADIIAKLDNVESCNGYIKQLIRADIEKEQASLPKTYRIKPEFIDLWGSYCDAETVVTEEQISRIASDWEKSPEEVKGQLYENTPVNVRWYTSETYLKAVGLL